MVGLARVDRLGSEHEDPQLDFRLREQVRGRAWPSADGEMLDGIGYAILRSDWESGTTTPVRWEWTGSPAREEA